MVRSSFSTLATVNLDIMAMDIVGIAQKEGDEMSDLNTVTDKEAKFAEVVLGVLENVECPMLMYDGEKQAVRHGLELLLDTWNKERCVRNETN